MQPIRVNFLGAKAGSVDILLELLSYRTCGLTDFLSKDQARSGLDLQACLIDRLLRLAYVISDGLDCLLEHELI